MRRLLCLVLLTLSTCQPTPKPVCTERPHSEAQRHISPHLKRFESRGRMAPEEPLMLRIHVGGPDERGLQNYLRQVADPQSPQHGKILTPQQFAERFGPGHEAMARVRLFLQKAGMQVVRIQGPIINAKTQVAHAEAAFATELHRFGTAEQTHGYGPLHEPTWESNLNIVAIHGLTSSPPRRSHAVPATSVERPFTGMEVRHAYSVPTSATGLGQNIGLLELDGFDAADIAAYAAANHFPEPSLSTILVNGATGQVQDADAQQEVTMDIELAALMAPLAAQIRVYEAPNEQGSFVDLLNEMANPQKGDRALMGTISVSWGAPEDQMAPAAAQSENALFAQMAAQGQTIIAASGDSGAFDDRGIQLGTDDPASQPWVLAAGGTGLEVHPTGSFMGEVAWSGGGGGQSVFWAPQPWQNTLGNGNNRGYGNSRMVPDVALDADPKSGHWVVVAGQWMVIGGTSAAAPLWAGMWADIQAARAAEGLHPLGFAASYLYRVWSPQGATQNFHDIRVGNNGYYPAVPGYDMATGLGSFDAGNLIKALLGV